MIKGHHIGKRVHGQKNKILTLIYTLENTLKPESFSFVIFSHMSSTALKYPCQCPLFWIIEKHRYFIYLWSTRKDYVVYCFVLIEKRKAKPSTKKKKRKKTCMCPKLDARKKEKKEKAKLSKEKNKSGIVYIVYVEVAQSLVATSCYSLFDLMFSCSS